MKSILLPVAFALLLAGCGASSSFTLNQQNLDKIQNDMSQADVRSILGEPTESKTDPIPIVGGTQTTYTYHNTTSDVVIVFKNDHVTEKHGTFQQ